MAAVDFNGIKADGLQYVLQPRRIFHGCHDFFFCHRARGFSAGFVGMLEEETVSIPVLAEDAEAPAWLI